ncbi:hypothetical protein QA612_03385 [Evansella sp. AB-P1]|uniref:hypothetical protein n=1 Tax=Evansella sp. AB-P1 TaxID=3037653 RepID=UPI00241D56F9|nr:hypothetical protein [Evansella sp. AB-P1]MDG5786520.1 hypothetical protein [Evansella sp. AB-P1]
MPQGKRSPKTDELLDEYFHPPWCKFPLACAVYPENTKEDSILFPQVMENQKCGMNEATIVPANDGITKMQEE